YVMCGDRQLAAEYAARAIARSRDVGQPDEEARTRIVLGVLAAERGDLPAAEQEMLAAAQRCRRSGMMPELVTIYHALGRLAGRQGQYKEAAAYHEQAFQALRAMKSTDVMAALHVTELVSGGAEGALGHHPSG
ncbi:MAG: tetratricopeptide repeat protein, partial [Bacillati bacterium ANGP1]